MWFCAVSEVFGRLVFTVVFNDFEVVIFGFVWFRCWFWIGFACTFLLVVSTLVPLFAVEGCICVLIVAGRTSAVIFCIVSVFAICVIRGVEIVIVLLIKKSVIDSEDAGFALFGVVVLFFLLVLYLIGGVVFGDGRTRLVLAYGGC